MAAGPDDLGTWFAELAGVWQLTRDSSDGSRFTGTARFTATDGNAYLLREEGFLRLATGEVLPASRQWVWRLTEHPAGEREIEIRYPQEAGGELYHRFRPEQAALPDSKGDAWHGEGEHLCGRDIYLAGYRLSARAIDIDHHVTGPAKDYRLKARLVRA